MSFSPAALVVEEVDEEEFLVGLVLHLLSDPENVQRGQGQGDPVVLTPRPRHLGVHDLCGMKARGGGTESSGLALGEAGNVLVIVLQKLTPVDRSLHSTHTHTRTQAHTHANRVPRKALSDPGDSSHTRTVHDSLAEHLHGCVYKTRATPLTMREMYGK